MVHMRIALALGALACAGASKAPVQPLVVPVDPVVAGSASGQPARFLIMANGISYPVLNPDFAARIGLSGGMVSAHLNVGPVMLKGQTGVVKLMVGGMPDKRRALWFDRPIAPDFDGALGPGSVPQPVITFTLRPAAANERAFTLPLVEKEDAIGTLLIVGGAQLFVQWDLGRGPTLATAAAGQALAAAHGGRLEGAPRHMAIRFGVERPVRALGLSTPVVIGPVTLSRVTVRITDNGDARGIVDADAVDNGEIVVAAKSKQPPSFRLIIGADAMARCSSLTFNKPAKRIILSCAP